MRNSLAVTMVLASMTNIADRIKRLPKIRRTRQKLNLEFGKALKLRGAVKKARLKKLAVLAEDVPGYKIPGAAAEALATYVK
jgi:hypothetical protein